MAKKKKVVALFLLARVLEFFLNMEEGLRQFSFSELQSFATRI